jgi:hypothetical protein
LKSLLKEEVAKNTKAADRSGRWGKRTNFKIIYAIIIMNYFSQRITSNGVHIQSFLDLILRVSCKRKFTKTDIHILSVSLTNFLFEWLRPIQIPNLFPLCSVASHLYTRVKSGNVVTFTATHVNKKY